MQIHVGEGPDGRAAHVTGVATIFTAAQLQTGLATLAAEPAPCSVELSQVEEFDTAGLQVLLAFERSPQARVDWVGASAAVQRVLQGWRLPQAAAQAAATES